MALIVDIKKKYGNFNLSVDFKLEEGILGVLGASGCGKSMTLKCIAGIVKPDEGKIILDDKILFDSEKGINLPPQERNVGYLFQSYALFPHMSVEENIAVGIKSENKQAEIDKYLKIFYLENWRKAYPKNLSGGQQQRVALARIFASQPEILMLDEPFSALDDFLKWQVELELKKILELYPKKILFVSHNRDEIYRFCTQVVVLNEGKVAAFTSKKNLFEKPQTLSASKLSGCKNHSAIKEIYDGAVEAVDWGITLQVADDINNSKMQFVGIRAHDILLVDEKQKQEVNTFKFVIENIVEDLFSMIIMAKMPGAKSAIRIELNKQDWKYDKQIGNIIYIKFPVEKIFLLQQ